MPKFGEPTRPSGAHGLKWVDGKIWMAMAPAEKIYLIEPETGAAAKQRVGTEPHSSFPEQAVGAIGKPGHLIRIHSLPNASKTFPGTPPLRG
jgi:hypothetical protein